MTSVHEFSAKTIDGNDEALSTHQGKVLLVVNVASRCGLTPQYSGLEALHRKYGPRGLRVLGFPCNQFMGQEPGTEEEIKAFCQSKYDVTFPLYSKVEVNGANPHPLYRFLKDETAGDDIAWNFEKFLVDRNGKVLERFSPKSTPDDPKLIAAIERALG